MKSTIAVTGATGFVGSNLVPYLEGFGYNVITISRRQQQANVLSNYESFSADFIDSNHIDVIIHLAGKAHDFRKTADPDEYYQVNADLTASIYKQFLISKAGKFIFVSSVKAAADRVEEELTEETVPHPHTHYGRSKLKAEQYMQSCKLEGNKMYYILRPCMIHGPGNKGNLNLLFKLVKYGIPYPLRAFHNCRSFLSIENLCFVIKEIVRSTAVETGIYNISDTTPLSTNRVVEIIAEELGRKNPAISISPRIVKMMAKIGDVCRLPFNNERLEKLTENYVVNNGKLIRAIGTQLPVETEQGLRRTIRSFLLP